MFLVRQVLGDQLRRRRLAQQRTLRDVSREARVSLGYLSEVERGRKEASSELLGSICAALDVPLSAVLRDVSDDLALRELLVSETAVTALPEPVLLPDVPDGDVVDLAA
ncbi:MAG TPA: helix-turn-helix transcriptional regulator [Mycobacteriales bacterium]